MKFYPIISAFILCILQSEISGWLIEPNSNEDSQTKIDPADLIFDVGDLGKIKGMARKTSLSKREYVTFFGIPYAQPLTTADRFLPPKPLVPPLAEGEDYFNAAEAMHCCPQPANIICEGVGGLSESCLTLLISTPKYTKPIGGNLPVVLFVHGGAFTLGSAFTYNGDRVLERDMVFVSVQYRLGMFGFFTLNTPEAPGNAAMYDLVEALKWVKKYIHHFGGDPNSITVSGQSAGSVAVTHLLMSPMAQTPETQFHKAIAVSGTALCEWGTATAEQAEASSLELATLLGCVTTPVDPAAIVTCMRDLPMQQMIDTLDRYQREERKSGRLGFSPVTPTIQKVAPAGYPVFLSESPAKILEEGRQANIPLIMGSTRHDGSFVLGLVYNQFLKANNLQNNSTFFASQMLPMLLQALGIQDPIGAVFDALGDMYLGEEVKVSGNFTQMIAGLIDLHTVFFFKAAEFKTLSLHSQLQPNSYWYSFDFKGRDSLYPTLINVTDNPVPGGVTHADDLLYLFNFLIFGHTTDEERAVSKRMVDYWANFAATGNPNTATAGGSVMAEGDWPTYTEANPSYLVMNAENTIVNGFPSSFWRGLSYELLPELYPPILETTTTDGSDATTTTEGSDATTTTDAADTTTTTQASDTTTSTTTERIPGNTTVTNDPEPPTVSTTESSVGYLSQNNYFILMGFILALAQLTGVF